MKTHLRVACLQTNAGSDWRKNLDKVRAHVRQAIRRDAELIAFPEHFIGRCAPSEFYGTAAEVAPRIIDEFCQVAAERRVVFLLGSLLEKSSHSRKFYNTSYLIADSGKIVARYRKIHLFDVQLKGCEAIRESASIQPGRDIVTGRIFGIKTGLAICYDLRFPELFRKLTETGSRIIFLPSNFTEKTGKSHWEILLRARAIENQVFIIAPNQVGVHPDTGIRSFGSSMVIDPWGNVLKRGSRYREEIIFADINLCQQTDLRRTFPVLEHRRIGG